MILVDTSVWIDHLRAGEPGLESLLLSGEVLCHPLVIGELACGNLKNRTEILQMMGQLPQVVIASDPEVLHFLEENQLMGQGLGIVDVHLLASTRLTAVSLWTKDQKLKQSAKKFKASYEPI